jgi:hypothetical protein
VEPVCQKGGTWQRLCHVHNLVLYLPPGYERVPVREQAQSWQADETGVEHRLSRLPTLLDLQDEVHGLVDHVADALTTPGRRPRLVRWNWQRDVNIVSCIVSRGCASLLIA